MLDPNTTPDTLDEEITDTDAALDALVSEYVEASQLGEDGENESADVDGVDLVDLFARGEF